MFVIINWTLHQSIWLPLPEEYCIYRKVTRHNIFQINCLQSVALFVMQRVLVCVTTGQVYMSLFDHNIEFSFKTEQTEASHSPQLNTPWNISHFRTLTTTNSVSDKYKHGGTVLTDNACFINSHRKYNFIFISPYLTTQELHYFHCFFLPQVCQSTVLQAANEKLDPNHKSSFLPKD